MEDNVSIKSSDSVTTSGEYEIVSELLDCPATMEVAGKAAGNSRAAANADTDVGGIVKVPAKSPTLRIANNGDFTELEKNLHEVIHDEPDTIGAGGQTSSSAAAATVEVASIASDTKPVQDVPSAFSTGTLKLDEHVDSRMYLSKYCACTTKHNHLDVTCRAMFGSVAFSVTMGNHKVRLGCEGTLTFLASCGTYNYTWISVSIYLVSPAGLIWSSQVTLVEDRAHVVRKVVPRAPKSVEFITIAI